MSTTVIKQVSVTFEFDPTTETVSNLKCFVDGVEKKKTTTRSQSKTKKEKDEVMEDTPIITLDTNKFCLNNKAHSILMEGYEGDEPRINVKYEKIGKKSMPIIGSDEAWDEEGAGNKVTKAKTVACRGKQNTVLAEYGSEFTLTEFKGGLWILTPTSGEKEQSLDEASYEESLQTVDDLDLTVVTREDDDTEIDEMAFKF